MIKIIWSPLSIDKISEIANYIGYDNPEAAENWVKNLFIEVEKLGTFPKSGRKVPEVDRADLREIIYGNYRIIYKIESKTVFILTVRHGKQLLDTEELE